MRFLKKLEFKRMLAMLLVVCTMIGIFPQFSGVSIYADSNKLREQLIQLMSGVSVTEVESIDQLTVEDLRCIALFLSNFYVPYNTSLDDTENKDQNIQYMVSALKNIGFKEDVAKSVIQAVYSASLSSAQKLYFCEDDLPEITYKINGGGANGKVPALSFGCDDDHTDPGVNLGVVDDNENYVKAVGKSIQASGDDGEMHTYYPVTLWTYLCAMDRLAHDKVPAGSLGYGIGLYWGSSSGMKRGFDLNAQTATFITAITSELGTETGMCGNAVMNTSGGSWQDKSDADRAAVTAFTQNIYIDWVGNVICDFGNSRVVLYPACMNPMVFSFLSESAIEEEESEEGDSEEESEEEPEELEEEPGVGRAITDGSEMIIPFNAVSTWGQWFLKNHTVQEESSSSILGTVFNTEAKVMEVDIMGMRGSRVGASWDAEAFGGSEKTMDSVQEWCSKYGIEVGGNGSWGVHGDADLVSFVTKSLSGAGAGVFFPGYELSLGKFNTINEYVIYQSVTNATIQDLTKGSAFVTGSVLDAEAAKYFSSESKFHTSSDSFGAFMQFGAEDYFMLSNYFLTYAFAYHNRNKTLQDKDSYVNFKFNGDRFPSEVGGMIDWGDISTDDEQILSFIYYLLHPVEGALYVTTLFKNKVSAILVGWHEDIVGGTDSNNITGMTRYLGFTGYVTSPSLGEISWIARLLEAYQDCIVYLVILLCIVLVCYVVTGSMSISRAVIGVSIFSFLAFLPPIAINQTADTINRLCDTLYSQKFDYWANTQLHAYLSDLSGVTSSSSVNEYIAALMNLKTSSIESPHSYSGVRVKWMTPKKIHEAEEASEELKGHFDNTFSSAMVNLLTSSQLAVNRTEDYTNAVGATYLYRDFTDIFMYGSQSYNLFTSFNHGGTLERYGELSFPADSSDFGGAVNRNWSRAHMGGITYSSGENLIDYVMANDEENDRSISEYIRGTSSLEAVRRGFLCNSVGVGDETANYYTRNGGLASSLLLGFNGTIKEINTNLGYLKEDLNRESYDLYLEDIANGNLVYGLAPDTFRYSLNDFVSQQTEVTDVRGLHKDLSSFYYALYTESPYYFFSYNIRDHISTNKNTNYVYNHKDLASQSKNMYKMLLQNNQEYFFNLTDNAGGGYGELRDFMNMHDLFYYIIPSLKGGNEIVDLFDSRFGMHVNSDMSLRIDSAGKVVYDGISYPKDSVSGKTALRDMADRGVFEEMTSEQLYKFWHDYNVWTLFQAYCPWIDTMEDCKYANAETIRVLGEPFVVRNPLDPTSYYSSDGDDIVEGRYMVFSRSEMAYYGLTEKDLTTVELKIIQTQDAVYKQTLDLMNYYTLADEVLINAFAMIQTFEFNKHFSESGVMGQSYILYPQGYEAKAFTYDAYLRLVIAESSGEPIQVDSATGDTSIYKRVISKTSLFFGIFLLINDVLSVYIMPCLKVAFLVMLFFISIALVTAASINLEINLISVIWKSILAPLGSYFCISVGFAWLVSLFMSNGAQGVVKVSQTISVGDPTTVIIIMIVVNVAAMILYFKLCKKCFRDFWNYIRIVLDNIVSTSIGAARRMSDVRNFRRSSSGSSYITHNNSIEKVANTAVQRGKTNLTPTRQSAVQSGTEAANAALHSNKGADLKPAENKYNSVTRDGSKSTKKLNQHNQKSYNDKAVKSREAADRKAEDGKMAPSDSSKGLRNRMAGGGSYLTGNNSREVYNIKGGVPKGVGRRVNIATSDASGRLGNLTYGTKENRGLTNAHNDAGETQLRKRIMNRGSNGVKKGHEKGKTPGGNSYKDTNVFRNKK